MIIPITLGVIACIPISLGASALIMFCSIWIIMSIFDGDTKEFIKSILVTTILIFILLGCLGFLEYANTINF